jgi:hypothetical protein
MPTADIERLHVGMKGSEFPHPIFTPQPMPPGLQEALGSLFSVLTLCFTSEIQHLLRAYSIRSERGRVHLRAL